MTIFLCFFIVSLYLMSRDASVYGQLVSSSFSNSSSGKPSFLLTTAKGITFFTPGQPKTILISSLTHAVHLDYLFLSGPSGPDRVAVFWTDTQENRIYRAFISGFNLESVEVIAQTGLFSISGLAVDWLGKNIYWLENNLNHIEVCRWDGSMRTALLEQVNNPSGLVIDPLQGYLFWVSEDVENVSRRYVIERSLLDGSQRQHIFSSLYSSSTGYIQSLALYSEKRELYWINSQTGILHYMNYEGLQHKVIIKCDVLNSVFNFVVINESIFWTDRVHHVLKKASSHQIDKSEVLTITHPEMYDIKLLKPQHRISGSIASPCAINNGGCSHLCLQASSLPTCKCPYGLQLAWNNKSCSDHGEILAYVSEEESISKMYFLDLVKPQNSALLPLRIPSSQNLSYAIDPKEDQLYRIQNQSIIRQSLYGSSPETILKMGYLEPQFLAVDWYHGNLYIFSKRVTNNSVVSVSRLDGAFLTHLHWERLGKPCQLALDHINQNLFWSHLSVTENSNKGYLLEMSGLDGSQRNILSHSEDRFESLATDSTGKQLCWLNSVKNIVLCKGYGETSNPLPLQLPVNDRLATALAINHGSLYYGNNLGTIFSLTLPSNNQSKWILNTTANLTFLDVFTSKKGSFSDIQKKESLCLPHSLDDRLCDYKSVDPYLLYMDKEGPHSLHFLQSEEYPDSIPSSLFKLGKGDILDVVYLQSTYFVWVDQDRRTVNTVRRDGKENSKCFESEEKIEGIAIDQIAGNMYWSVPRKGQIWVSRFDGQHPFIILSDNLSHPSILAVHSELGFLFWSSCNPTCEISRSSLRGSNIKVINQELLSVGDITVDRQFLYWSDPSQGLIQRSDMDGQNMVMLLASALFYPLSLAVYDGVVFWTDREYEDGSIIKFNRNEMTVLKNESDVHQLLLINELSVRRNSGLNPCSFHNGGCSHLCLFQGKQSNSYCFCSHGKLASNGKDCEDYSSFILFTNRNKVESIHLEEIQNPNPPVVTVKPSEDMNNLVALAFDSSRNRIFFNDLYQKPYLFSIHPNGSGLKPEIPETKRMRHIEGLAFDSSSNLLLWTESTFPSIWAMSSHKGLEEILALTLGDKPRGIVYHHCSSQIFWTNWNLQGPSIETCVFGQCDTSYRTLLRTKLEHPNGLVLHKNRLFWSDSSSKTKDYGIYSCKMDGTQLRVHVKGKNSNPFDLVVLPNQRILWTDFQNGALCLSDKNSTNGCLLVRRGLEKPLGLTVVQTQTFFDNCEKKSHTDGFSIQSSEESSESSSFEILHNETDITDYRRKPKNNPVESGNHYGKFHKDLYIGASVVGISLLSGAVLFFFIKNYYRRKILQCCQSNIATKECYTPLKIPGSPNSVLTRSSLELDDVTSQSFDDAQHLISYK